MKSSFIFSSSLKICKNYLKTYRSTPTIPLLCSLVTTSSIAALEGAQTNIFSTPEAINMDMIPVIV
jgi:hypothetical protein